MRRPEDDHQPYQYFPPAPVAFDRDAFTVVQERLEAFSTPYPLSDVAGLVSVENLAHAHLNAKRNRQTTV